ncbi:hypothetical protein C8R42DRAFT_674009 [Lentinula raphanica]|nr:hypothetical protein C8R42DRAFT_674009 [Lentinula raphanica]
MERSAGCQVPTLPVPPPMERSNCQVPTLPVPPPMERSGRTLTPLIGPSQSKWSSDTEDHVESSEEESSPVPVKRPFKTSLEVAGIIS